MPSTTRDAHRDFPARVAVVLLALSWATAGAAWASPPQPVAAGAAEAPAQPAVADFGTPSPTLAKAAKAAIERIRRPVSADDRQKAIDELVGLGREALPLVIEELQINHRRTWAVMIYALGASRDPRVLPILAEQLKTKAGLTYLEVLYAMSLAGDDEALLLALRSTSATTPIEESATAVDMIAGSRGRAAVPALIAEIPRRAANSRAAGLAALGTICDASAVPFLLEWSRAESAADRRYALAALARIGDPRAAPRLREALDDPDVYVRATAAEGLGYVRDPASIPRLAALLRTETGESVFVQATWALGLIGGEAAARSLVAVYQAENTLPANRIRILRAIERVQHPAAIPAIDAALADKDANLGHLAVLAAAAIEPKEAARDVLLRACESAPTAEAALIAAQGLVEIRDPRATPCIVRRLRESIAEVQGIGPTAEEVLRALPLTASASVAESLERLASEQSAPAVAHRVRIAATGVRLVQEHGNDLEPWIAMLEKGTPSEVDLALLVLGDLRDPRATEPLMRAFGRIDFERAHEVPRALGLIGSDRATSFLVSLLVDDSYSFEALAEAREEAAIALARYARTEAVAEALLAGFESSEGTTIVPLLAYARVRGPAAIDEILRVKPLLLQRRGGDRVHKHERVNWALRMLRLGRPIEIDALRDVL